MKIEIIDFIAIIFSLFSLVLCILNSRDND